MGKPARSRWDVRVKSPRSCYRLLRGSGARALVVCALGGVVAIAPTMAASTSYDWPQFNGHSAHSGANNAETAITTANVGTLQRAFQVALPAVVDAAPAMLAGVGTPNGPHDLLYVTATDGHVSALDAHTGAPIWSQQYGPGSCRINNSGGACYTTASPAVDPNRQYVYSYGLDGYAHKLRSGDGGEVTGNGWPELTTAKGLNEKGSSSLSIATAANGVSYLYVAHAGYPGDNGDYQGHLTTINLSTGAQTVFNTVCSDQAVHFAETPGTPDCGQRQGAIWGRAGVVYDAQTDRIYTVTGNADYNPGQHDWGDSVLALKPDGTGAQGNPLDSYTPGNYQQLQDGDVDLGSSAPALLPVPANASIPHLAVQVGKDEKLRLLNLDNLSGQGGPGHTDGAVATLPLPQGGEVHTALAVWVDQGGQIWVFVADDNGLAGVRLAADASGRPTLTTAWVQPTGGTSPLVANGVLYYAHSNDIRAIDPATGQLLWDDTSIGGMHWQSPVVANGMLYIADNNSRLTAYALPTPAATRTSVASTATPIPPTAIPPVLPTATSTATASPGGFALTSRFERGDTPPAWVNSVDGGGYPAGGLSNVSGICCGLPDPEAGVRSEIARTGSVALMYSGLANGGATTYAYMKVFDLSGKGVTVGPTTTLSYWIYPQSSQTSPVSLKGGNSACVALDVIFTDGSNLRDSGATDQHGVRLHPAYQCGHLPLDTWTHVTSALGARMAGRTIAHIDVGYDQPGGTGGYRGYIDDVSVST